VALEAGEMMVSEYEVVFVAEPRVGERAVFVRNSQQIVTSPAVRVQCFAGHYSVDTASGSRYIGVLRAPGVEEKRGQGPVAAVSPVDLRGLNWGAFLLAPFWGVAHNVPIGLLALIPGLGLPISILVLVKGNEMGWKNRRFRSFDEFSAVQRAWLIWGIIVTVAFMVLWSWGMKKLLAHIAGSI
jgi:hypothetical protein